MPHPAQNGSFQYQKTASSITSMLEPQSRKRKLSPTESSSFQTQKKVRFNKIPTTQPEIFTHNHRQTAVDYFFFELGRLPYHPKALSLTEISGCFRVLQKLSEDFSKEWFGNGETFTDDIALHELKEKNPALFYTIQYVLDASTTTGSVNCGWREFFANPKLRQHLAFAILGEWFIQRIFKHTAFGLSSSAQQEISEQIDKKYLHHDAIVRAKQRSRYIHEYFERQSGAEIRNNLKKAVFEFADELLIVLEPLMPLKTVDKFDLFTNDLRQLIGYCAGLHLSMLFTGYNGTVFMYPGGVSNGNAFHREHNHFVCVNPSVLKRPTPSSTSDERLVVKMTCWTRVEAYVPHGKDMLEMADKEKDLIAQAIVAKKNTLGRSLTSKETAKIESDFDWNNSEEGRNFWEPLPRELWADAQARREKQDMMARSAAIRKTHERKRRMEEEAAGNAMNLNDSDSEFNLSDSDSDSDSNSSYSDTTEEDDEDETPSNSKDMERKRNKVMRGPYTTIYHCICPHIVYCEWTLAQKEENKKAIKSPPSPSPPSLRQINTLAAAVAQARSELRGSARHQAKYEDFTRALWDMYATNSLYIEWGVFLAAVLSSIAYSSLNSNTHLMLYDLFKSSATSLVQAANTVKEILRSTGNLLVDPAKLAETIEREWLEHPKYGLAYGRRDPVRAFTWALRNINPKNLLNMTTTTMQRLMLPPESNPAFPVITRDATVRSV